LEHVSSLAAAESALRKELPGQEHPWLLLAPDGDIIAYFYVERELDGESNLHVVANISVRHYKEDAHVAGLLQRLRARVGGAVTDGA